MEQLQKTSTSFFLCLFFYWLGKICKPVRCMLYMLKNLTASAHFRGKPQTVLGLSVLLETLNYSTSLCPLKKIISTMTDFFVASFPSMSLKLVIISHSCWHQQQWRLHLFNSQAVLTRNSSESMSLWSTVAKNTSHPQYPWVKFVCVPARWQKSRAEHLVF